MPAPPTSIANLSGFTPVIDEGTQILILGSFPGVASLALQQYYGHPRNQFWPLLSAVLDDNLVDLPYLERLIRLRAHGIGLWDVLAGCERNGSLDSAIRNPLANQFDLLHRRCPQLARICFNGKTSGKFATQFSSAGFETLVLPSSSPANAQSTFEQKLALWRGIIA
ncbi:DNA-deoxyinosine glycosylase [Glaciimonas sp. CA11.2]|uniref:DNA-deoxyinosine glycosylase n=1 Tax=unclassified Glaciimonas TaxID=2644401 RepID=UPI002AB58D2D|nr:MULTISPECIES: DNA-deoxyinosine glycosylase [unclassified Glaciimonas]MDY7548090.1 DNA-deoxyinosine glycosylase [Glaciimonas sp. CA11.2]MEB0010257.1 DNA-deoxyinosine glycosylase [Glaciimonas sp. Cout2]MEB0083756.1 DNA-deoxyinosine glycosylase [Glaciimonas sp. Gout2]MEB0164905.1 DNA-deoxyinosine glycosylase [Glaciimonas sp. CA11.2]